MPEALLIGDPEDNKLQAVKDGFENAGWEVSFANDAATAYSHLSATAPSAIVIKRCGEVGRVGESEVPTIIRTVRTRYDGPIAVVACSEECAAIFEQAGANRVLYPGINLVDEVQALALAMVA